MWWEIARVCVKPYAKDQKLSHADMADIINEWQGYFFDEQGNEVDVEFSPQFVKEADQDPEPLEYTVAQNIVNIWVEPVDRGYGYNSFSAVQEEIEAVGCNEAFYTHRNKLFEWAKLNWEFWPEDYESERFAHSYGFLIVCKCESHTRYDYFDGEECYFEIEEIHDLEEMLPKLNDTNNLFAKGES